MMRNTTLWTITATGCAALLLTLVPIKPMQVSGGAIILGLAKAFGKDGSDDGGSDDSGSGKSGGGGSSKSDSDSDSDSSGSGSSGSDDGGSDDSGSDDGGSDDSGSDDKGSDDNGSSGSGRSDDDSDRGGKGSKASGSHNYNRGDDRQRDGRDDRPRVKVNLPPQELREVRAGQRVLVDDLGRVLEVEIENEHGQREVVVKTHGGAAERRPGPIKGVRSVPVAGPDGRRVLDDNGRLLEVEVERHADDRRGDRAASDDNGMGEAARELLDRGRDLSPDEEARMIERGWQ